MSTWKEYATEIVAVQTPENIEILAPHFPYVTFIERKIFPDKYPHKPNRVTIGELLSHGPGLLINSDCELTGFTGWEYSDLTLKIGIRHDYKVKPGPNDEWAYCGIDVFLISPDVLNHFEERGFILGSSVWDIWFPWHYLAKKFNLEVNRNHRINHLTHKSEWDEKDTAIGEEIFKRCFGISHRNAVYHLKNATGR
jgi:hypothetical protein